MTTFLHELIDTILTGVPRGFALDVPSQTPLGEGVPSALLGYGLLPRLGQVSNPSRGRCAFGPDEVWRLCRWLWGSQTPLGEGVPSANRA